ncbi:MAG: hypothetical protein N2423_00060, partial [Novosphingobium sp.]|nr:hypothetical protein [Novosphingobium sp.]
GLGDVYKRQAINGVIIDAAGQRVTGLDTVPLITINGVPAAAGGRFDALSTINGCIIGANCRAEIGPPKRVDIEGTIENAFDTPLSVTLIGIDEEEEDKLKPLIDEPVTGVGNDDLWQ